MSPDAELGKVKRLINELVNEQVAGMDGVPVDSVFYVALTSMPKVIERQLNADGYRIVPLFRVVFCDADRSINLIFPEDAH